MSRALRTLGIFLLALFLADRANHALVNAARGQYAAHLERGTWWPKGVAALESAAFLAYALVFGLIGAVFGRIVEGRYLATVLAGLLGAVASRAIHTARMSTHLQPDPRWVGCPTAWRPDRERRRPCQGMGRKASRAHPVEVPGAPDRRR